MFYLEITISKKGFTTRKNLNGKNNFFCIFYAIYFIMKKIEQFVDLYSDDIIFLREAKRNALNNPLNLNPSELSPAQKQAAACRLFVTHMVTSIDFMINEWKKRDNLNILESYFTSEKNSEKIKSLLEAFQKNNIAVDEELFKDYLAIRFLRNILTHQHPRENELYWIKTRGFPDNFSLFTEVHWNKLQNVEQNMLYYLMLPTILNFSPSTNNTAKKLKFFEPENRSEGKVIAIKSFEALSKNNLIEIQNVYRTKIEEFLNQETSSDTSKINSGDLDSAYSEVANAGIESHRFFKDLPYLFDVAVFNWKILQPRIDKFLNLKDLDNDVTYMKSLENDLCSPIAMGSDDEVSTFKELLHNKIFLSNLSKKINHKKSEMPYVLGVIHKASISYEIFCEIDVLKLFGLYLPLIVPTKREESIKIAQSLLCIFELNIFYQKLFSKNVTNQSHVDYIDLYRKSINGTWWKNK